MTEYEKYRRKDNRIKYICYAVVIGVMTGYHYLTEDILRPSSNNQFVESTIIGYHLKPRTEYIVNEIYNVKLCKKYYQADATCTGMIHSVGLDIKETL